MSLRVVFSCEVILLLAVAASFTLYYGLIWSILYFDIIKIGWMLFSTIQYSCTFRAYSE